MAMAKGTTVWLKSGSPSLTVEWSGEEMVQVCWFDPEVGMMRDKLCIESLTSICPFPMEDEEEDHEPHDEDGEGWKRGR